jgi:hypothetical protein
MTDNTDRTGNVSMLGGGRPAAVAANQGSSSLDRRPEGLGVATVQLLPRRCAHCGASGLANRRQRYCGVECRNAARLAYSAGRYQRNKATWPVKPRLPRARGKICGPPNWYDGRVTRFVEGDSPCSGGA